MSKAHQEAALEEPSTYFRLAPATGNVGPDLTHIGSRRTIGAATRPQSDGAASRPLVTRKYVNKR